MNSRERFLTAMTGGRPDRVPCTPDMSNMIPCRLTDRPFWEIYLHGDPPLWRAYLHAARHFGIDPWFYYGSLDYEFEDTVRTETEIVSRGPERIVQRIRYLTPDGEMEAERTYYRADPPTPTEKPVKDIAEDFAAWRHFFRPPIGYGTETVRRQKEAAGDDIAVGTAVGFPGFQSWMCHTEGGVAPLAYAAADRPELLEELRELSERRMFAQLEMIIESGEFDYVLLGGSGALTLASPKLFDRYAFPAIREATRICREAGLPTMLHSCGREAYMVKRCAEETDLDCINPLEIPPMGDCDLAELKRLYGERVALMGNLHTTDVMLRGSRAEVVEAARACIDDAAAGGGFILSTGDQCGRDTPEENIRALVEVCRRHGRYG